MHSHISVATSDTFAWPSTPQHLLPVNTFPSEEELLRSTGASGLGGLNTAALVFACLQATSNDGVPTLTLLSRGSYNAVFLLTFPNGKKVVARIPFRNTWSPGMIESQVATMAFASSCISAPTPTVYAWQDDPENPANAPYLIMEFVEGTSLVGIYNGLDLRKKTRVPLRVAELHASLARGVPFTEFGSLVFSEPVKKGALIDLTKERAYAIGPLVRRMDTLARKVQAHWPSGPSWGCASFG